MPLEELRKEIDELDEEIVRLVGRRAEIARKIGEIKEAEDLSAYSPERERAVYEKITSHEGGPLPGSCIRAVYCEIMSGAIALQKETTVVYPGPPDSFGHMAAREKFGASVDYLQCPDVARVFEAVSRNQADYGVVPAEATLEFPAGERSVTVISEAFAPAAERPEGSAENEARFFVIGKQSPRPTGRDKTSLVIRARDEAGALQRILKPFAERGVGVNLTRIESARTRECSFLVDLDGHIEDERVRDALAEAEALAEEVAVLGSYPRVEPPSLLRRSSLRLRRLDGRACAP